MDAPVSSQALTPRRRYTELYSDFSELGPFVQLSFISRLWTVQTTDASFFLSCSIWLGIIKLPAGTYWFPWSHDATRAASWDKPLFCFNKYIFQWHQSIWNTMCLLTQTCLEAPLEAQQKQLMESINWDNSVMVVQSTVQSRNDIGTNGLQSSKPGCVAYITLCIGLVFFLLLKLERMKVNKTSGVYITCCWANIGFVFNAETWLTRW